MCFPFPQKKKRKHINKIDPHPFQGQSREVVYVYVYWFFSPPIVSSYEGSSVQNAYLPSGELLVLHAVCPYKGPSNP